MKAARLHGPREIRVDEVPEPEPPGPGEALVQVGCVGVCGSDLHTYLDGRIGDTEVVRPAVLGHEFMGRVLAVGEGALDASHRPLVGGERVAVDPNIADVTHEQYELGHPNLAVKAFLGLYPDDGGLQERIRVPASVCVPVPDGLSDDAAALLEPLGVALHTVGLAHLEIGDTVAVLGSGPIGLLTQRLARLAGAGAVYAFDRFDWRVEKARAWGATEAHRVQDPTDALAIVERATAGRGVDVAIEAAWADESVAVAAEITRLGGRLVLAGIPGDDRLALKHSTARRKGLTIRLVRRMKHTYPRAIRLVASGAVDLDDLVSHHYPLERADEAFAVNARYDEGVHKVMVQVGRRT
ncbi:MAG: zinc-binding dehydrogenase [Deinococcales bacterium]|jgi:L-iditol 2-dehydrogenase